MVNTKRKKSAKARKNKTQPSKSVPADSDTAKVQDDLALLPVNIETFHEVDEYAIILLDVKGNIVSWNKGAERIKGYTAKEIIGKNYRIFYINEDRESNLSEKLLKDARKNGRTNYEGWRVKKNGIRFWGSMTLTALHHVDGTVKGYLKITRDITDKKTAEDMHSNFVEELRLKNAELSKSEERYHKMVAEVIDYAIILLDKDGTVLDGNKGAEKLKGYSPKDIIGKNFRLFYPKESKDAQLPEKLLAEAEKKGSVLHEGWRIKKDGKRFWGSVAITALHDDSGGIIGFSKVTRDLTERKIAEDKLNNLLEELKQANEKLRESEERFQRMITEIQDYAIILLDEKGNIQNWNAGAQKIKGYASEEIIGKNFKIFYTSEDRGKKLYERLLNEAKTNGRVSHEGWRVRRDGSRFWGSVVITALHGADGNIIGFSKVTRDLTEKKLAEDALRSSAAQLDLKNKSLQRLNEDLASFSHVASHDLKEPLRKIETFAHRIKDEGYDPQKNEGFVDKIIDSASRMRNLIVDLLAYSEASNQGVEKLTVDLNKVLNMVKVDLEVSIAEKGASISFRKLPTITGVHHQLHQLFLNLVSNAIKFSKPDIAPQITITHKLIKGPYIPGVSSVDDNQYHHFSVKDNGIGFANEKAAAIFEPFQRLHSKNTYNGSGLGLAIAKRIVTNHNGIITAESAQNAGAAFNIYLPVNGD